MKKWWQEQPLVISALQEPPSKIGIPAFDDYIAVSSYNVEQSQHPFFEEMDMTFYDEKKHGKILDDYLENMKKTDVKLIVYTNTHCLSLKKAAENSAYCQLGEDGKPLYGYNIFPVACVNPNSAFHKNLMENLKGLCTHDIGGIFFDGPLMRKTGCFCETCKADFLKKYGHSIYEGTEYERLEFRVDTVTEHIKLASELIKSINPNIALYINNSALRPDVTGSNTRKVYDYVDLLGAEAGFYKPTFSHDGLWGTPSFMKHLECIIGDPVKEKKPMVNFIAANDSSICEQIKTSAETALTYAQTLANGANIWYGFHNDVYIAKDTPGAKKALEYNQFILANKQLYKASKTCARVALMWSETTANHYSSSVAHSDFTDEVEAGFKHRGDHYKALMSYIDMLLRNHIQFDIVDEISIERGMLSNYDALILPGVACMSDETAEKIKNYVLGGGNVLGNFDVAMYDEKGKFAKKSKLADLFGMVGEPEQYSVSIWNPSVMFAASEHFLLKYLDSPRHVAPYLDLKWDYADDVSTIMVSHPPRSSVYDNLTDERYPSFVERKYGKGTAFYISGTFGETFADRHPTGYINLIKAFCEYTSKPVVKTENAGLYEVVLRRQEDKFLLHIVNLTGDMARPLNNIVPLTEIDFTLNLDGFGIEIKDYKLAAFRGGNLKNVCQNGAQVSFTLDKLNEYEVIVIE